MLNIPDGMNEQDVWDTIERVVNSLAPQFVFGCYDIEDIRQEGRLFAIQLLEDNAFDNERGKLHSLLNTHVKNRLLNLRRDKYTRHQSPCGSCEHFEGCVGELRHNCQKYQRWERRNASKRSIMQGEELPYGGGCDDVVDMVEEVTRNEIVQKIDRELPSSMRVDYRKLVEGDKLPPRRLKRLLATLHEITQEYHGEQSE